MNPFRLPIMRLAMLLAVLVSACVAKSPATPIPGSARSGDVVAYVGIVPAAVARGRMAADATTPHPVAGAAYDRHHLVVALFDAAGDTRIEQARVVVTHRPPRGAAMRHTLTPMRTGELTSFAAEFSVSRAADHRFELEVTRPGRASERFAFRYDNQH